MENNANHTWEPEEEKISSKPAYEQQKGNLDNSIPEEEILPETDDYEEESFEEEIIEEPADDDSDYEMFTEDENADSGFKNSIRRSL